jgi:acyl carrier protein
MTTGDRARMLLAAALGISVGQLPENPRMGSLEVWDSLAHARLLIGLEEELNRELDPEEIARIEDLSAIESFLAP